MSAATVARASVDVLLVDDHPILRQGVRNLLESTPGFRVVAEADDASSALERAMQLDPDVALVDIVMQGGDWVGVELARELKRAVPRTKAIMLSQFGDRRHVYRSLHAGARGYIVKSDSAQEYIRIIEAVLADAVGLSSGVEILRDEGAPRVTPREAEILELIHDGYVHEAIAILLKIDRSTVRKHVSNVRDRFNLHIHDKDDFVDFLWSGKWRAYVDWSVKEERLRSPHVPDGNHPA